MQKIITPLQIADYKSNWFPGHSVQVDIDSDGWGKDFCKTHFEQHAWSFSKHTEPDDSHTFYFEDKFAAEKFTAQYNQRNSRFHSVDAPLYTDEELQEQIALFEHKIVDISALVEKHKANDELETAEACEKIKQVYENELHYVLTGERVKLPWEDDLFADD